MGDSASPTFSSESLLCGNAIPNATIATSRQTGWRSLYLRHDRSEGRCDPFETVSTPDQTLVVVLNGSCELAAFNRGRWRKAQRQAGSTGMTPGGESSRLCWSAGGQKRFFESSHLYLPQTFFCEAADHYRRAGISCPVEPLASLAFDDPAVAATIASLVRAMYAGAPDLHAETVGNWLAVHLLSQCSPWRELVGDGRHSGDLSDARLLRVVDFMGAQLHQTLSLDQLAAVAGISKFHFVRLFKQHTGQTPFAYLTGMRMEAARHMLATTAMPIRTVAAACGYAQSSHFNVAFRRRFGCTPTQVRVQPR